MLEVIFDTSIANASKIVNSANVCAGIVYDKQGNAIDKILFEKISYLDYYSYGKNVFSGKYYYLNGPDEHSEYYISDIVSLENPIKSFLGKDELNLMDLYKVYRMFVDSPSFINRHLDYFDMQEVEVGYKCKTEIRPINRNFETDGEHLYNALMNIINYRQLLEQKRRSLC